VIRTGLLIVAKALAVVVVADAMAFLFRAAAFRGLLPLWNPDR
jgi:hypothetical protein